MTRRALIAGLAVTLALGTSAVLTAPAQADTGPFVQGAGDAVAQAISVSPALSGEDLGIETGVSIADYLGTDGQAESQILTSALIGAFNVSLPGGAGGILAESSGAPTTQSTTFEGEDGEGGGTMNATAAQSSGAATTNLATFNLPGVVSVSGGQSTATTSIVNGQTRQAEGTSSIGSLSLLGGLVSLNGLHWTATQSTGAKSVQSCTFSVGSISLDGKTISVPVGGLNGAIALINAGLAQSGLRLGLPTQVIGADGSVEETSLSIGLDKSALGKELVSPYVNTIQPVRTLLNTVLTKIDPTLGESDLVLEIVLSVLAGEGSLDIDLGGAYATTNGTSYSNPFAGGSVSSGPSTSTSPSLDTPPPTGTTNLSPLLGAAEADTDTAPTPGTPPTSTGTGAPKASGHSPKLALQRVSSNCQSTSTGGCQTPHSVVILIALAVLTAGLLAAESLRMRRRKRLLLPEDS
jgi:hypothetical protein